MRLRQQQIPNFISGISQQPQILRSATQLEVGDNVLSSPLDGLGRRPPSEFVAKVSDTALGNVLWHLIDRDENERYLVAFGSGFVRVWDVNGVEKTVNYPNGNAYLFASSPADMLSAFTNADYTFVANRTVTVQKSSARSPVAPNELFVWVRNVAPTTKYSLTVNGVEHNRTTDNLDGESAETVTTVWVASSLADDFIGDAAFSGWVIEKLGSTIRFVAPEGVNFTASHYASGGDSDMVLIKGRVQNFSDLPAKGRPDLVVEVAASDDRKFEKYWVRFDTSTGATGVWRETVAPNTGLGMNPSTMPHALVREADGTFTFKELGWVQRQCGDEDTNPWPSFVGRTVSYVTFYRNRLVVLSGENVVMSKAGEFFDFFKDSNMEQVDTDPIDYAAGSGKVSDFWHALEQNEDLLLFSEAAQYVVKGSDLLSPKTVSINTSTSFAMSRLVRPVASGNTIFFTNTKGSFASLQEYYREGDTLTNDATEVSEAVQSLLPADVRRMAASEPNNMVVLHATSTPNVIYTYTYYWRGQEKIQAAWNRWVFAEGTSVRAVNWIEGVLHIVMEHPNDGVTFEQIYLRPATFQDQIGAYLDRRCLLYPAIATYDPVNNNTGWTLPYTEFRPLEGSVTAGGWGSYRPGRKVKLHNGADGRSVWTEGDLRNVTLYAGLQAPQVFEPSRLFFRDQNGNSVTADRTQINRFFLSFQKAGYFRVEVTAPNGRVSKTPFTARLATNPDYRVGQLNFQDGELGVPVKGRNDEVRIRIINDSAFPAYFLSGRWDGYAINKGM
ncbi:hypothetical protein [Inquilinus limosus]|uniref:phage nozzle protein n=1 Tax=Inquilinus limosus TaxID=171674 RepID=UPI00047B1AE7|nr:hypothetical protein [Inquilinus limosus]